jgi:hypothetical protein
MYNGKRIKIILFEIIILLTTLIFIGPSFLSIAQAQQPKSLLEQLEAEEKKERISNIHQGPSKPATETLKNARDNAQANTNSCVVGSSNRRKIEDVKEYIIKQEEFQIKMAASLEKFTSKLTTRNQAVNEFNSLINQNNEVIVWGQGRVTNGVCGPVAQTEIIGKAIGASNILIEEYRKALGVK